jgi:hypothetical protein
MSKETSSDDTKDLEELLGMRSGGEDDIGLEQSPALLPGTVTSEGVRKRAAASSTGKKDLQLEDAEEEKPLVGGPLSAADSGWGGVDGNGKEPKSILKNRIGPGAVMAANELAGVHGGKTKSIRRKSAKKLETADDVWDVFLSYRVASDKKLVQDIYWRLVAQDVVVNGKTRKMKPFWDTECLKPGESWEEGFKNAIISSTLIVPVFSRKGM